MKQNTCNRQKELERIYAVDWQASADRAAVQSAVEEFQAMMRKYAKEPLPGESPADAFARPGTQQSGTRGSSAGAFARRRSLIP